MDLCPLYGSQTFCIISQLQLARAYRRVGLQSQTLPWILATLLISYSCLLLPTRRSKSRLIYMLWTIRKNHVHTLQTVNITTRTVTALTIRIRVKTDLYSQTERSAALYAVKVAVSYRSIRTKNGISLKLGLQGDIIDNQVSAFKNTLNNILLNVREKAQSQKSQRTQTKSLQLQLLITKPKLSRITRIALLPLCFLALSYIIKQ